MKGYLLGVLITVAWVGCASGPKQGPSTKGMGTSPTSSEEKIDESQTRMGPEPSQPNSPLDSEKPEGITVLVGPGLLQSYVLLGMLEELKKEKIRVHRVIGSGWSVLLAGIWRTSRNPNDLDWKLLGLKDHWFLPISTGVTQIFKNRTFKSEQESYFQKLPKRVQRSLGLSYACGSEDETQIFEADEELLNWEALTRCLTYPGALYSSSDASKRWMGLQSVARKYHEDGRTRIVHLALSPPHPNWKAGAEESISPDSIRYFEDSFSREPDLRPWVDLTLSVWGELPGETSIWDPRNRRRFQEEGRALTRRYLPQIRQILELQP